MGAWAALPSASSALVPASPRRPGTDETFPICACAGLQKHSYTVLCSSPKVPRSKGGSLPPELQPRNMQGKKGTSHAML